MRGVPGFFLEKCAMDTCPHRHKELMLLPMATVPGCLQGQAFLLLARSRASSSREQPLLHDFSNSTKHLLGNLTRVTFKGFSL